MLNKIHYIKGWDNLPPHGEDKILFIYDNVIPNGYRIETGHYYEYICGSGKPCFFRCSDKGLFAYNEIEGVFAWTDLPAQITIPSKIKDK